MYFVSSNVSSYSMGARGQGQRGICSKRLCFGCVLKCALDVLCAVDIILLSATVDGLQKMCHVSVQATSDLKLTFNFSKSVCIAFGPNVIFSYLTCHWVCCGTAALNI